MKIIEKLWLLSLSPNLFCCWRKLIWSIFTIQWNLSKSHSSAFLSHWHFLPSQWTLGFQVYGQYCGIYSSILMEAKRIDQEREDSMICWQFVVIEFVSRLASLMELMENLMMVMEYGDLFAVIFRIGYLCHCSSDLVEYILNLSNSLIVRSDTGRDVIDK